MERESFVFYASFLDAINEIPNANQLKVYQAIANFAIKGIEPTDLKGIEKAVFILIKPQIEANNKRYVNGCKGAIYGAMGGRPKTPNETKKETPKKPLMNPKETPNDNENDNVNDNDNIKRENNIKEKSLAVVETTALTPQAEVFEIFAKLYKQATNIEYLGKQVDYINLAKLIKKYGKELVIRKIKWLLIGCQNSVFWFSKDINDFTISTLTAQWDRILPKLTEDQKREQEKKKKEEEDRQRVKAELAKQGIVFEDEGGMKNVRLQ